MEGRPQAFAAGGGPTAAIKIQEKGANWWCLQVELWGNRNNTQQLGQPAQALQHLRAH